MVHRTEAVPFKRIGNAMSNPAVAKGKKGIRKIGEAASGTQLKLQMVYSVIGFLLGRAVILGFLNPFSIAFVSVALAHEVSIGFLAISVLIGVFSTGQKILLYKYIFSILAFLLIYMVTSNIKVDKKILTASGAALANLIAGYFVVYMQSRLVYDLFMVVIESALVALLVFIYDRAFPVIKSFKSRKVLSTEEIVAFAILAAFCFVGAEFNVAGLSIKDVSVILITLAFSYFGSAGAGAAVGIILGIVQALSGNILPSAIGVYGLCGVLGGLMKNLGKWGVPVGFILGNALMTFYINGSTEVIISFYEIAAAAILFMCIPKNFAQSISACKAILAPDYADERGFNKRVKEYTMDKLKEVSDVFTVLSNTLKESVTHREYFSQVDAAQILDQVVDRTCTTCGMCDTCWQKEFYRSYQHLFGILSSIESDPEYSVKSVPKAFKDRCMKPEEVAMNIKYFYDIYRNNLSWKKKINESRMVVCEQLREVSSVVSNLALKLNMDVEFNREMEEMILVELDTKGIHVQDVIVAHAAGTYEIDIHLGSCGGRRECVKNIIPVVNKVTGKKFVKKDTQCLVKHGNLCNIKLKEAHKFQVATGVARAFKSGTVSGDNHSFMELKDGKFMLALSDGMGTGAKAAKESSTTISLLEKFLYAGFDKDVAVKTINSLLLMKSTEETYATIDMTIINQYKGEVEFVKVGAVSAFIKFEDHVDVIKAGSLPVGILSHIDMEFQKRKLKDGDFVIMVTDGILDSNKEVINKEKWLADMIDEMNTRNPQKIADDILSACLELNGGKADDDMSVMVAKIWEIA